MPKETRLPSGWSGVRGIGSGFHTVACDVGAALLVPDFVHEGVRGGGHRLVPHPPSPMRLVAEPLVGAPELCDAREVGSPVAGGDDAVVVVPGGRLLLDAHLGESVE